MDTDVVLATAYATAGWLAEAATKAALLGGAVGAARGALASIPGLVVCRDGSSRCFAGMEDLLS